MNLSTKEMSSFEINSASFRDSSGFIFTYENEVYRAIAPSYFHHYDFLNSSELYSALSSKEFLLKHTEENNFLSQEFQNYKVIKPEQIPFISFPYEWCFSQLKDAALLTPKIQSDSLNHGMTLKDASAYNIQFMGAKPIFIDTLSFEKYNEGPPWQGYGEFCRLFLAPLALMS